MDPHTLDRIIHPDHEGSSLTLYNLFYQYPYLGMATEHEEMLRDLYIEYAT